MGQGVWRDPRAVTTAPLGPALDRLGDVAGAQPLGAGEVRDGARHPQHLVEGGSAQRQPLEGGVEQRPPGGVEPAAARHVARPHGRVETTAVGLDRPHGGDPGGDAGRRLPGAAPEFSERHRRHTDDEVEPLRQRGADPRPPAADLAGRARAVGAVVAEVAAGAGSHGRHELGVVAVERLG
jgi:hypothetical protein